MDRTISIGQLRQNPTTMIREVAEGSTYTLTDRGRPVADISPYRGPRWRSADEVNEVLGLLGPDLVWADEHRRGRSQTEIRDPWAVGTP